MKKKTQRIIIVVLAVIMLLSVAGPLLSVMAGAITQDDINDIKDSLNSITAQKEEMEQRLAEIRGDLNQAEEQVALIRDQIVLTEQQISASQLLLDQYDGQIREQEEKISALEEQEAEQYSEFYAQVRWMEETGSVSYLSILFQASSFSELLDYAMLITDIMEYSNRIIDELEETQQKLGEVRDELQTSRDEQAAVQAEIEQQKAELEVRRSEAQTLYNEIAAQESIYNKQARELAESEAEIERELKEAEERYAAELAGMNNTGDWCWPVPGYYRINSLFGGRISPITGRWESHTGADVGVLGGTPILAAQAGIVTTAKYNVSYGNYCIINHGNGYATLYAHMRYLPAVSAGERVEKGQTIGYVGSTGASTANHLHFELRINGVRDNVLKLYPNLPYTGPYVDQIRKELGL